MKTVMIIDDEPAIRLLYQTELESAGFRVIVSSSPTHARQLIKVEVPDLITLDIKMGDDLDGITFLTELRSSGLRIPIIIITAYDIYQYDFSAWAADEYLLKSGDTQDLVKSIERLIFRENS